MDIIVDYDVIEEILEGADVEYCYREIDAGFGVAHVRRSQVRPISIGYYGYSTIPKLYGLMQAEGRAFDASPLVAMGNIRIQNPPLALQGSGVIMGFIDTGIDYREDVFRREDGSTTFFPSGTRPYRAGSRRRVLPTVRNTAARILTGRLQRRSRRRLCPAPIPTGMARGWLQRRRGAF